MRLIINGMNMPNDCCQCKLARYDDYENETFCPFTDVMCLSIGRQDNCPLEELQSAQPETHDKRTETHGVCLDAISRQAAIDAFEGELYSLSLFEKIQNLPSAQPIIRCKDCKHYEWDKLNDAYCCLKWGYNFPNEDDFCSRAERRTL